MSLTRDLSTKENREHWEFVRKTAEGVRSWPAWKAGLHDSSRPNVTVGEILGRPVAQSQESLTDQHNEENQMTILVFFTTTNLCLTAFLGYLMLKGIEHIEQTQAEQAEAPKCYYDLELGEEPRDNEG